MISPRTLLLLICALLPAGRGSSALAQEKPCPVSSDYKYLRFDEDYLYLRNPACRTDRLDAIKFIPLKPEGDWYVSFGGETRQTGEYFINPTWGQQPEGPPYSLQRYMGHVDLHLGERVRFFVQFKSGLEFNETPGPRPIDKDEFDIENGFFDFGLLRAPHHSLTIRIGRQELGFGATRWVSAREGPNVRQTFDGVRLILSAGGWRTDTFVTKPTETNPGVLDDAPNPGQSFWGIYATRPVGLVPGAHIDLYYLGLARSKARFNKGSGRETRQSIGARLWRKGNRWDYDFEPIFQFGSFGSGDIRAWAAESESGYTFRSAPATPRIGLKADIASGDKDPHSLDLQTFNPLFPHGLYDQLVNLVGHVNFIDALPGLTIWPKKNLSLTPECEFIWRESLNDGVYGVGGNLVRPANGSRARYVGSQPSLIMNSQLGRHFTLVGIYTHFLPGSFLHQTGPAKDVDYFSSWVDFKF